jgi:hypothetical protein
MQQPDRLEEANTGITEIANISKVPLGWMRYTSSAFSLIGMFATCSRWSWLDIGLNSGKFALGLHFFEGWLVFLALAVASFYGLYKGFERKTCGNTAVITGIFSLITCLVFMVRTGFSNAANAAWISLFCSFVTLAFGIVILITQKNKAIS